MSYNSKYTGQEVENLLDQIANGDGNILTCEFMGEVGDVIWSDDDTNRVAHIHEWMEALSNGKVCVLDFDDYEGTYAMVHAINYRSHATFGLGISRFSYVFEGYLYEVEYDEVALPVTLTIVSKTKIGGSSEGGGSSAYAEVDHGTSDTTFELTPNTFHIWDEVSSLDLSLGAETSGVANEYLFQFTSGSTPTTLSLPDDIKFTDDLVIEVNKIYQISILKGLGSVLSWDNGVTLIENKATYNEGDFMNGSTLTFEYPTASEIKLYLSNYSSPYLTIPAGTTTITIDWYEPSAPVLRYFEPSSDDTYIYINT